MNTTKKILLYLRIIMPLLFLAIGIYCAAFPEKVNMEPKYSKMFGYMLVAYGAFRAYRVYKAFKEEKSSE